jgi:hypothetical protein
VRLCGCEIGCLVGIAKVLVHWCCCCGLGSVRPGLCVLVSSCARVLVCWCTGASAAVWRRHGRSLAGRVLAAGELCLARGTAAGVVLYNMLSPAGVAGLGIGKHHHGVQ